MPTNNPYSRVTKEKYKDKGRFYLTRQAARNSEWEKNYIYYQHIAIKEDLGIESEKIHLDIFDKDISRHCWGFRQVFIIKKKNSNLRKTTATDAIIFWEKTQE